jgi:hypothetical protein
VKRMPTAALAIVYGAVHTVLLDVYFVCKAGHRSHCLLGKIRFGWISFRLPGSAAVRRPVKPRHLL